MPLIYTGTTPNFNYTVNGTEVFVGDDIYTAINADFEGSLTIPNEIDGRKTTKIGAHAFDGCKKLVGVTIPETVKVISDCSFQNSGIRSLVFPSLLEHLGESSFYGTAIKFADLSKTKLKFPKSRFIFFTSQLETLTLPTSLENMPYFMVAETKITQITIPQSLISIENGCFEGCLQLNTIYSNSPNFVVFMNTLYSADYKIIYRYPSNGTHDILPMTHTFAGSGCFSGVNFAYYTIPKEITYIFRDTFRNCHYLKTLDASNCQVRDIPHAFAYKCYNLTSLLLPQFTVSISYQILCWSYSLTFLKIPATVRIINGDAFSYSSLSNIEYCGIDTFTLFSPLTLSVSVSDDRFTHPKIFGVVPLRTLTCPPYRTAPNIPRSSKNFCFTNKKNSFIPNRGVCLFLAILIESTT